MDKHFGMLLARWEGLLERGNDVMVYMSGGHYFTGGLKLDDKGYMVVNGDVTYIELGDVVAVTEIIHPPIDEDDLPF